MARPVVALLTDFGTRDPYVAAMKGVVLSICPDVTLVDLTHDIPPHDVRAGARTLAACCAYYPPGTIFVAVVDPGVGTTRRGVAVDVGDYRLVGPDNGVLVDRRERERVEAVPAAHREPHVRGPRPLRAGCRVARQGHGDDGPRPRRARPHTCHVARAGRDRRPHRRGSGGGGSVRQSHLEHRADGHRAAAACRADRDPPRRPRHSAPRRHLRRGRLWRCLRALRQHRSPRDRGQRRERLRALRGRGGHAAV